MATRNCWHIWLDQQDAADNLDVVLLDSHEDGIEQITRTLEHYEQLDAIHFLSHGTDGSVKLGNTWLDADRLTCVRRHDCRLDRCAGVQRGYSLLQL